MYLVNGLSFSMYHELTPAISGRSTCLTGLPTSSAPQRSAAHSSAWCPSGIPFLLSHASLSPRPFSAGCQWKCRACLRALGG